ncbi:MAG: hypothetical protein V4692_08005 [Bdellovibrionota bacterium]
MKRIPPPKNKLKMLCASNRAFRTFSVLIALSLIVQVFQAETSFAGDLCEKWEEPKVIGYLDTSQVSESSGIAVSLTSKFLYHINDSGSAGVFFVSSRDGNETKKVTVSGFTPSDTEDLSAGPCPESEKRCLAIGDIGDNRVRRKSVKIAFIEETGVFSESVKPVSIRSFSYPGGSFNAEAMAILPNGDVVVVTKETTATRPASIFRAKRASFAKVSANTIVEFKKIGEIDSFKIAKDRFLGGMITGMSVSRDGRRFALLTYGLVVEFAVDLQTEAGVSKDLKEGVDYKVLSAPPLSQQESITYDDDDRSLIYSTEFANIGLGSRNSVPIMRLGCAK